MKGLKIFIIVISLLFFITGIKTFALDYKFPWATGYSWQWTQLWHCGGNLYDPPTAAGCQYNRAIDIGTYDWNRALLVSADGQVNHICDDGTSIYVDIYNSDSFMLEYFHIASGYLQPNITVGSYVKQGQLIGYQRANNFSGSCGSASQPSTFAHVHLAFGRISDGTWGNGKTMDGWTLSNYVFGSGTFTNGATTKGYGDTLLSSNVMLIRNNTVTSSFTYETKDIIKLGSPDATTLDLAPSSGNTITIRTF